MTLFRTCILVSLIWFVARTSRPQTSGASTSRRSSAVVAADFEQAKHLLAQGSLEQAADAVKRGLARSPRNVTGLNLLGVIYHQQGNFADAEGSAVLDLENQYVSKPKQMILHLPWFMQTTKVVTASKPVTITGNSVALPVDTRQIRWRAAARCLCLDYAPIRPPTELLCMSGQAAQGECARLWWKVYRSPEV